MMKLVSCFASEKTNRITIKIIDLASLISVFDSIDYDE